jgi:hypothetical protein
VLAAALLLVMYTVRWYNRLGAVPAGCTAAVPMCPAQRALGRPAPAAAQVTADPGAAAAAAQGLVRDSLHMLLLCWLLQRLRHHPVKVPTWAEAVRGLAWPKMLLLRHLNAPLCWKA